VTRRLLTALARRASLPAKGEQFVTKIYRESLGFFLSSLPTLLLFAFLIEAARWFLVRWSSLVLDLVALNIIAYGFHRHFLFGETLSFRTQPVAKAAPPFKFGRFLQVSLLLFFYTFGLYLFMMVVFDLYDTAPNIPLWWTVYLLVLGLLGIALPANVAQDKTYRVRQGIRVGAETIWRLSLGPGLVGAATFGTVQISNPVLENVPDGSLILLADRTILTTVNFLVTILAVAVLCEMYRKTRPGTVA
jgi:hypothetical protein